jgi:hypothetical protein
MKSVAKIWLAGYATMRWPGWIGDLPARQTFLVDLLDHRHRLRGKIRQHVRKKLQMPALTFMYDPYVGTHGYLYGR